MNPFPLTGGLLDDSEQRYLNDFLDGLIQPTIPIESPITPTSEPEKKTQRKRKREDKRDLLTEDEKRLNHVVSEQRRRALIRDGFEALVQLTPSLQTQPVNTGPGNTGGSHSKSTILFKAAEYIKELQQKVELLQSQLKAEKCKYPLQPSFVNVPPSFLPPDYYRGDL